MSEQILERPTAPIETAPDSPARSHRAFVVVAAAIVAGLVLGGTILFLIQPGGGESPSAAAAEGAGAPDLGTSAEGSQPEGTLTAKKSRTRVSSRDPFAPLISKPAPTPTPKVKSKASTSGSETATGDSLRPSSGATLAVLSISSLGDSLTLKLDGKKYEVEEGETFAKDYRLYDIFNADCAGFLHGDSNVVACRGDQVTVG